MTKFGQFSEKISIIAKPWREGHILSLPYFQIPFNNMGTEIMISLLLKPICEWGCQNYDIFTFKTHLRTWGKAFAFPKQKLFGKKFPEGKFFHWDIMGHCSAPLAIQGGPQKCIHFLKVL